MIIENKYGIVNFDIDFSKYKKIGISFSGGCDSSLLLYLLLRMVDDTYPDVEIIPITGITINKGKWKLFRSQEILDYYRSQFFNLKNIIKDRLVDYNWTQEEYGKYVATLAKNNIIDIRLFALTKNPPYNVMEQHDLVRKRETSRDGFVNFERMFIETKIGPIYDVFRNVDKRWIAQCYHDFGLMDHIYPLTVSCERLRETSDMIDNEEPCRHCWWCREKKMAFGTYDGGVV